MLCNIWIVKFNDFARNYHQERAGVWYYRLKIRFK